MIRITKRAGISKKKRFLIVSIAIILTLVVAGLFIMVLGHNPVNVYLSMVDGAFGSKYRFTQTIIETIPLVITSLGIAIAFKMKFWNIGAEGQIIMGAFGASLVALNFSDLPSILLLPFMFIISFLIAGFWAAIPAFFKARFDTNETIFTLMLNYIALKWITYLQYGPWKDPSALGFPKIANFSETATLPSLFGIHIGWIIAIILAIVVYLYINHTKKGYEISVIGESQNTAKYAGMNVTKIVIMTLFVSGGISGLTGMIEASGVNHTLSVGIAGGVGYTAIITAWLAYLNPGIIIIVSLLFAAMIQGGAYIQMAFHIPQAAAEILQGMILFFVLGSEFFARYKVTFDFNGLKKRKNITTEGTE